MRIKQGRFGSNDFRRDKFVARIVSDGISRDIRLVEVVFGLGFASSDTTSTNRISRDIPSLTIRVTNNMYQVYHTK